MKTDPYSFNGVVELLMRRDDMSREDAEETLRELTDRVADGEDPEELMHYELGLEPDYIWAIIS